MDLIKESVDRAYNTNIVDVIIAGDFNFSMALNSDNKITELMNEFHLSQLITDSHTLPNIPHQRFTLFFVRNTANILQSHVLDPFIPDQIPYHCPIVVYLKFTRPSTISFKRKIWNYKLADYDKYRRYTIPNKVITVKSFDQQWVTCRIKQLIRKHKRTFLQYRGTKDIRFWIRYETVRNTVVNEIRKSKYQKRIL